MIRRGILKGLSLAAFAPTAVVQPLSGAALTASILKNGAPSIPDDGIDVGSDDEEDNKWELFSNLSRKHTRLLERQRLARDLLGGWPPHIACMHSNALWFRAARAAAYIQKQDDERRDIREGLKAKIWKKAKGAVGL